jgi:hypothetical protein
VSSVLTGVVVIDHTPEEVDLDYWGDRMPTGEEIGFAQRAICVHAPEEWQHGTYCVNCRAPFPCRLHRWGWRVLQAACWTDAEVAAVVATFRRATVPPWREPTG